MDRKIKEFRICSVQELLDHIDNEYAPNDHFFRSIYRGQSNDSWEVIPSLFRIQSNQRFKLLENHYLDRFKRMSYGMLKQIPDTDSEWFTLAQHHGLPTRLIDWTYNPLVALYFAVENSHIDGALFHIVVEDIELFELQGHKKKKVKFESPRYLKSNHISNRVSSQSGCFLEFPVFDNCPISLREYFESENNDDLLDLRKLTIPSKSKPRIRKQLDDLGINEFFIYPDLDGLSRYIKADDRI